MDSYTFNKIAGAVLWSALVVVGSKVLIEELSIPKHPEKPGYEVKVPGETKKVAAKPSNEAAKPAGGGATVSLGALLKGGNAERGAKVAKRCTSCHTFDKGGANKVGPNLYGSINRKLGAVEGFKYSPALIAKGGTWTFAEMKCFLEKPRKCLPGTKMSFPGLRKPGQLADLLIYMNSKSDNPAPLPK